MRKLCAALLALALGPSPASAAETPLASFPYTPGLDVSSMDPGADPCVDFYQYTCGGWMKNNPIPADQPRWNVYAKLFQDNQRYLWGILDSLARNASGRSATQQKIGDYFAACMDEQAVEGMGARPMKPFLNRIQAMKSKPELPAVLAELHLAGSDGFFRVRANQDFADSTHVIAWADAGGISLPDRDYYTRDDDKSKDIRAKYAEHVARTLELMGDAPDTARREAARVLEIEIALAKASLTRVDRRDPYKIFHKMDLKGVRALTPEFDWDAYLHASGLPRLNVFNVTEPEFYRELQRQLHLMPLDDIKTYLRWHYARAASPYLSKAFVDENFAFFSRTLRGVKELRPRWKRCVSLVDAQLGEALGEEFVRRAFGPELKARTLHIARRIEEAMRRDVEELDWMGPETKRRALLKLDTLVNKIGYPDKWRD